MDSRYGKPKHSEAVIVRAHNSNCFCTLTVVVNSLLLIVIVITLIAVTASFHNKLNRTKLDFEISFFLMVWDGCRTLMLIAKPNLLHHTFHSTENVRIVYNLILDFIKRVISNPNASYLKNCCTRATKRCLFRSFKYQSYSCFFFLIRFQFQLLHILWCFNLLYKCQVLHM